MKRGLAWGVHHQGRSMIIYTTTTKMKIAFWQKRNQENVAAKIGNSHRQASKNKNNKLLN